MSSPRPGDHDLPAGYVVHHLYRSPDDLRPFCGVYPGRDLETGEFHAGHDLNLLLEYMNAGMVCCATCLSPAALGGWSPMVDEDAERMAEMAEEARHDDEIGSNQYDEDYVGESFLDDEPDLGEDDDESNSEERRFND